MLCESKRESVLILVLVEHTLGAPTTDKRHITASTVLILVLVEHTLGDLCLRMLSLR